MERLSVVTFNIGNEKSKDLPEIEKAKAIINKFVKRNRPSLLYLQENRWKDIKDHVPEIKDNYTVVSHNNEHATVLYRTSVLEDKGSGSQELLQLFRDAFSAMSNGETNPALTFETFKKRASVSKLKRGRSTFLAISWHGEHNKLSDDEKRNKFKSLIRVIKKIHIKEKLPVVLGGDFNIDLKIVKGCIEEDLKVYDYHPKNRENIIDFFVVTRDVELSEVRAFGEYMSVPDETGQSQEAVFDHDPVQAHLSFISVDELSRRMEDLSTADSSDTSTSSARESEVQD